MVRAMVGCQGALSESTKHPTKHPLYACYYNKLTLIERKRKRKNRYIWGVRVLRFRRIRPRDARAAARAKLYVTCARGRINSSYRGRHILGTLAPWRVVWPSDGKKVGCLRGCLVGCLAIVRVLSFRLGVCARGRGWSGETKMAGRVRGEKSQRNAGELRDLVGSDL